MSLEETLTVGIEIEEGDVITFNNEEWKIKSCDSGWIKMRSKLGTEEEFTKEKIESQISFAGNFSRVKADYVDNF